MKILFPILILGLSITLTGCNRYLITLNETVISEPPKNLAELAVADSALDGCIGQTIADTSIKTVGEFKTLVCTHAGIASVDGIEQLSSLQILNLADNQLTSIVPLLFLGELKSVNLSGNKSLNCEELGKLRAHLPNDGALIPPDHCS